MGLGGTNARLALCHDGKVEGFRSEATPSQPRVFFEWLANQIVLAVDQGALWVVIGVPGPVNEVGAKHAIGPLVNIPGLSDQSHILEDELAELHPKLKELIHDGFPIKAVNDGMLAAFAGASVYGNDPENPCNAVASCIIGTGVGGAIVRREKRTGLFRPSESLFEIGHVPIGLNYQSTFETALSGTGLHHAHGIKAEEIPDLHEAWQEAGQHIGQLAMLIALIGGADLILMCGGVGSNAYRHYRPYLERYLQEFRTSSNIIHRQAVPEVIAVTPEESQNFEMYGAEGVIRDYLSSFAKNSDRVTNTSG